ncbi:MAG: carboxypeptidase regulatory-like domain-containing protein [Blastocatellia bacterium]|nr:carboxypeptidase regulatory-like domain-containing protein [Blastocatellia bacterium]
MRFSQSQYLLGFLLALVCEAVSIAQNATGSITGAVTDPNNEVIANATVTVTNKATGAARKLSTKGEGNYTAENLVPGEYEVKIEAQGFITQIKVLMVQVGSSATGNFSMTVGATNQTIEVSAGATVINTTDTVIGGVVNRERIESLPLNGRSFLSMALLEPSVNVSYVATSGAGNVNNFFQVSVGGAPQQSTMISVDGSRVNDRVTGGASQNFSAESVQEFQIQTNNFDLSSGTVSSGAVNIISRTGSNEFHGGGFFFFRDHNMAAFPGFKRPTEIRPDGRPQNALCLNPTSDACKRALDPFFVRRQYGGSVGGPIKKDKLFFFGNYERGDQVGVNAITYDDPVLSGFNHIAQQPFKQHLGNVRLDYTVNQKNTAFVRASVDSNNSVSGGATLESNWIASSNYAYQTQFGMTSVLRPTLVNDFRFSFSYLRNSLLPPTQAQCESIAGNPDYCFGLNGVRPTILGVTFGNSINVPQDRHPRTYQWTDNVNWAKGAHRVRFGGSWEHVFDHGTWNQNYKGSFSTFSPAQVLASNPTLYAALPASLKPGGSGATIADLLKLPVTGTLSIGIGSPDQPARPFNYDNVLTNDMARLYVQDAWQLRRGFTLNYGLAWSFEDNILYHDLTLPQYLAPLLSAGSLGRTIGQRYKNFDPALGFAWALGKDQKTVIRSSASLHHTSPNVGFFKLNQRILFGPAGNGLGAFSGAGLPNPKAGQPGQPALLNFNAPVNFTAQDMINNLALFTSQLTAGAPFKGTDLSVRGINITKTVAGGQALDAIYDNDSARFPYTINLDLGVQREIKPGLAVSADFVMRRGVGFGAFELFFPDLNRWNRFSNYTLSALTGDVTGATRNPVIPACVGAQGTSPTAQCSLGPIQYGLPGILSRYTALQIKVDKRLSQSYQLSGAYSFSRYTSLVSISNYNDLGEGFGPVAANPHHRFTLSGIWDLPKYKGEARLLRGALNGWQLATIVQMQTGPQTSVTLGTFDVDGDGAFVYRLPGTGVSSFGNGLSAGDIRRLVDQYNASIPAPKDTLARDIPKGPQRDAVGSILPYVVLPDNFSSGDSFLTHDLRVTRTVSITEKVKLHLIGEGFNIFNIANLTGFSGALNGYVRPSLNPITGLLTAGRNPDFTFGQPTGRVNAVFGSGGPRAFQLAARLSF